MSEYLHVEKPFLDQLATLGWTVIDQGQGVPGSPAVSLRTHFREWLLPETFRKSVSAINRTAEGKEWLTSSRTSVARLHAAFAVIIHACAAYVRVRPRRDLEQTRTRLYATIHAMNEKHAAGQEVSDGDDADAESGSEARARPRGVRRAPPPDLYIDSGTCNCFHPTRHPLSHANGLFACSICRL